LQQAETPTKEVTVPELLQEGLPDRSSRTKFDFAQWADGQAWKFVKGADYGSSTETFRANVKRWAKVSGYAVELRPYPALDRDGREIPLVKADAVALGVRFAVNGNGADRQSESASTPRRQAAPTDHAARSS
jgi:hypothetical protein